MPIITGTFAVKTWVKGEIQGTPVSLLKLHFQYDHDSEEGDKLLAGDPRALEEGLEMRGGTVPPSWLDKLEEAQYSLSKWVLRRGFVISDHPADDNDYSFQDPP